MYIKYGKGTAVAETAFTMRFHNGSNNPRGTFRATLIPPLPFLPNR